MRLVNIDKYTIMTAGQLRKVLAKVPADAVVMIADRQMGPYPVDATECHWSRVAPDRSINPTASIDLWAEGAWYVVEEGDEDYDAPGTVEVYLIPV